MYAISACLLGLPGKYDGTDNATQWVQEFAQHHQVFPVCPETVGGLPCPRPPAEKKDHRVVDREGNDVTLAFQEGARLCWQQWQDACSACGQELEGAILKANSPSCGRDVIYDGTFSKVKIPGSGVFAQLLLEKGIPVFTEQEEERFYGSLADAKMDR